MDFYQTPKDIFNPIAGKGICKGTVVLPFSDSEVLAESLAKEGVTNVICAPDEVSYMDREWWESLPAFDWCVAVTQGRGKSVEWVLEPGIALANRGLILLDRLTFLEPTNSRKDFLTTTPLSHLVVLNPRPDFRSDQIKRKDSVTSAWFVFDKTTNPNQGTKIEYAVCWQRPGTFSSK